MSELPFEEVVDELKELGKRRRLTNVEAARAAFLLKRLLDLGNSPTMIEVITDRIWKVPRTKNYIKGHKTAVSTAPELPPENTAEMVRRGLSFDDVQTAKEVDRTLRNAGVSIQDIAQLIRLCFDSGQSLDNMVKAFTHMQQARISISELDTLVDYHRSLAQEGIDSEKLATLTSIIIQFGDYDQTTAAVSAFGDLQKIQSQIKAASAENQAKAMELARLGEQIAALEQDLQSRQDALRQVERLKEMGFGESSMQELATAVSKFGNIEGILKAINIYRDIAALSVMRDEQRLQFQTEQTKEERLGADNSRMIATLEKLSEQGLSVDVVEEIWKRVKEHGDPIQVLQAISYVGNIFQLMIERNEAVARLQAAEPKLANYEQNKKELEELKKNQRSNAELAVKLLREILEEASKPQESRKYGSEAQAIAAEIEQMLESQVDNRLRIAEDRALTAGFRSELKKAVADLLYIWSPSLLGTQTPEKVKILKDAAYANPFVALKGEWKMDCSDCNCPHTLTLRSIYDIKEFLRNSGASVPPESIHRFVKGEHTTRFSLDYVVKEYLKLVVLNR